MVLRTQVTSTCGEMSSENCTYFDSSGGTVSAGACSLVICPCGQGICQVVFIMSLVRALAVKCEHLFWTRGLDFTISGRA